QQRSADAPAPGRWRHVEVLEVDAVPPGPGGEVEEPERHAERLAARVSLSARVVYGHVAEDRRAGCEERRVQLVLGQLALLRRRPLVLGQLVNHRNDGRHVLGTRRPDREASGHACLVSQKILAISSIFSSSFCATAGSAEPLAPLAPASFVASLESWCGCGDFSEWLGLK